MKYKQKLKTVEAFQYMGDFGKLSDWFTSNSPHATVPFFWSGRELFNGDGNLVRSGDYLVLSAGKRSTSIMSKEDFEASYGREAKGKKK